MTDPFAASADPGDLGGLRCDLSFMETISQKMRIPNRLKVTEELGDEERAEDIQMASLHMCIPDRISMAEADMQDIGARPYLYGWFQHTPSMSDPPPLSISPCMMFGNPQPLKVDSLESRLQRRELASSQNSNSSRTLNESEICLSAASRKQRNAGDHSNGVRLPFPSPGPGQALFSLHNVFSVLKYIGHSLSERFTETVHQETQRRIQPRDRPRSHNPCVDVASRTKSQSISHDYGVPEGVLENFSVMEIVTLRRQLNKLNRRLQLLEQESRDRARKELILYSIIVTACFVNSWLWLRK
ncbi:mitochondrial fission factor homolog A [Callorhinchus milii]|uniref:mitochondrial fission factor homolog A n=1 Tax=Callorhinchus milii TaxID=7868 RepID=UPI0004575BB6|nr:mitochondrial fission factor homolog A [Callorhinchus milii]|eukprot:gi/632935252/ref/XP_007889418.1/ PREDICTED: mitochondrial fission factor homolog A-like isoform X1 [Callorhinchus milii]